LNGILKPSKIKEQKVLHIRLNLHKLLNLIDRHLLQMNKQH